MLLPAGAFIGINAVGLTFMSYLPAYTTVLVASLVRLAVIPWVAASRRAGVLGFPYPLSGDTLSI